MFPQTVEKNYYMYITTESIEKAVYFHFRQGHTLSMLYCETHHDINNQPGPDCSRIMETKTNNKNWV